MRRSIAGLALAVSLPATAQFKLPDGLPPLPEGDAICNESGTHCVVNKGDLVGLDLFARIAGDRLAEKDREIESRDKAIEGLRAQLALEQSLKHPRCAVVEKAPLPGGRPL